MELPDNARPIKNSGDKYAAFIARNYFDKTCSYVMIYERTAAYGIAFNKMVANYETATNGATASARREIARLEKQA